MTNVGYTATPNTETGVQDAQKGLEHATKTLNNAKKVKQDADNQETQRKAKEQKDLQVAKQEVSQAPAAPSAMATDDKDTKQELKNALKELMDMFGGEDNQEANDGWKNDLQELLGKAWSWVSPELDKDEWEQRQRGMGNGVAGVRGSRQISMRATDESKDRLPGGEADNVSEDEVNKKQLNMGQKVEMEHTDDPEIAREIARDHLAEELKEGKEKEDQEYYTKLKKVHEDKCGDGVKLPLRKNLDYGAR